MRAPYVTGREVHIGNVRASRCICIVVSALQRRSETFCWVRLAAAGAGAGGWSNVEYLDVRDILEGLIDNGGERLITKGEES